MKAVLVADDEFDLAETLQAILQGEGYSTDTCSDGRSTLEAIKQKRPDLLLMDVMMPLMSGYEVLKVMKQTPGMDSIPVVLMSAAATRLNPADFRWDGFLKKPFTLDTILKTVEGLIGSPNVTKQ
jgi:CheY-like chemotaxis protein